MGDSCLAMYAETECVAAIESMQSLRSEFPDYCRKQGVKPTDIKASVHLGEVIIGDFGAQSSNDMLGKAVNTVFKIMTSPGLTISEQVYRKLPSDLRSPWKKQSASVVYKSS